MVITLELKNFKINEIAGFKKIRFSDWILEHPYKLILEADH